MDIRTEKGRETLLQVADAICIWRNNNPSVEYVHTPANMPADIDGLLVQFGTLKGIVEVKCRVSMSLKAFRGTYKNQWLITFDKVVRCMRVADALQVPFVGFLYFPHEATLLHKTIYRPKDGLIPDMMVSRTRTQKTVNGGQISRDNAFIDMTGATVLK